jgi:hypothetical protein
MHDQSQPGPRQTSMLLLRHNMLWLFWQNRNSHSMHQLAAVLRLRASMRVFTTIEALYMIADSKPDACYML